MSSLKMDTIVGLILLTVLCSSVGGAAGACRHVKNDDMIEYSCVGGQLSDLDDLPESTGKIRISNMPISRIAVDTFSRFGSELWVLGCSQCGIEDIEPGAFERLQNLQQLSLDSNRLSTIKESWFKGLDYLTYLDLNYNAIQSIEDGVFANLPSLVDLRLSGNKLECLNLEAVSHLKELKRMFLSENSEFKCPNAVSTFLENRGVSFEKDPDWARLSTDLIPARIPWEYENQDWRTTPVPVTVPPTPAYRERLHLPPTTTIPPAQPEIPYRPPYVYTPTTEIVYPEVYFTPEWERVDYDDETTVQPTTSRSSYDDSRTKFLYVPPRPVAPIEETTPTTTVPPTTTMSSWPSERDPYAFYPPYENRDRYRQEERVPTDATPPSLTIPPTTTMGSWPSERDPYAFYPPYENGDRYSQQQRIPTDTTPPSLAPSPTNDEEMSSFMEPNVERTTTVPYRGYWSEETVGQAYPIDSRPTEHSMPPTQPSETTHVVRPYQPASPEIFQPASPDDFFQAPYNVPTLSVRPPPGENYRQRQNGNTPSIVAVEMPTTTTTDKPLPNCPTSSSPSVQRSYSTIVIALLLVVMRNVIVERF